MSITRAIIISDTHGFSVAIEKVIKKQPNADKYIFLGDGTNYFNETHDVDVTLKKHPELADKFVVIKGNSDEDGSLPIYQVVELANHKIFATHGHKYSVGFDHEKIIYAALREDCDIILYGHTHARHTNIENGMYIMNPGSAIVPRDGNACSFGILDILDDGSVAMNISDVE